MNWALPTDWLTQFKGYIGGITDNFWGVVLVVIGIIFAVEFITFIVELAFARTEDRCADSVSMSDIVHSHTQQMKRERLEFEFEEFGIRERLEKRILRETALEAERYRARIARRW